MTIVLPKRFPTELAELAEEMRSYAEREGLDFFEVRFEMIDSDQMNQIAAFGGFPMRYNHWRFGMEYERMRKQQTYGLSKIYEMVINTDPCYAYLLADNAMVDHKTVMAHVFAHCDFFKNNQWFSKTNRKMIDEMANHATRVRRYIDKYGLEKVEQFLDCCLSIENLIDPHSVFFGREPDHGHADDDRAIDVDTFRIPSKGYMDRYVNPPGEMEARRAAQQEKRLKQRKRIPREPVRDILAFLLTHAPLEDWQADLLSIVREEAYYFAPQAQTKIMNEGWATYWHSRIMTRYALRADEMIDYAEHHSGTLATSRGRLNPYKLGVELFRDIEERWNKGRFGPEYDRCESLEQRRQWDTQLNAGREKIFEVRRIYNDVGFIDTFLTPDFVEQQMLYHYRYDPHSEKMRSVDRDFDKIKQQLLFSLTNHGDPYIYVVDGNYHNRGELYLAHKHTGVDVQISYAQATLTNMQQLWQRPVHLQARIEDDELLFSFDGSDHTQQKISDTTPQPANNV